MPRKRVDQQGQEERCAKCGRPRCGGHDDCDFHLVPTCHYCPSPSLPKPDPQEGPLDLDAIHGTDRTKGPFELYAPKVGFNCWNVRGPGANRFYSSKDEAACAVLNANLDYAQGYLAGQAAERERILGEIDSIERGEK